MKIKNLILSVLIFSAFSSFAGGYGMASNEKDANRYIPQNIELMERLASDTNRFKDAGDLCNTLYVAYQSLDALDRRPRSKSEKERDFAAAMNLLEISQCEGRTLKDAELKEIQVRFLEALELLSKHWRLVQTSTNEP